MNKIFQTALLAVLASMIFYCGATYKATVPDAVAQDAGSDAGPACDCPEPPAPALTVTSKVVFTHVFEATFQSLVIGTIPDFDPDGPEGMPTVQHWIYDDLAGFWKPFTTQIQIDNAGNVHIQNISVENVNRHYRLILTFTKPNPDL